jgi:hypothetical protein
MLKQLSYTQVHGTNYGKFCKLAKRMMRQPNRITKQKTNQQTMAREMRGNCEGNAWLSIAMIILACASPSAPQFKAQSEQKYLLRMFHFFDRCWPSYQQAIHEV